MANQHVIRALGGLLIPVVTADPSSPPDGTLWYNSTANVFRKRADGVTSDLSSSEVEALGVGFDNSGETGDDRFTATNVQDAISEVMDEAATAASDISTHIEAAEGAHGASTISYDNNESEMEAEDVQDAIDELDSRLKASAGNIDNLVILTGVEVDQQDLGTFEGDIIPNDSTIKAALQALETEIEDKADKEYVDSIASGLFPKGSVRVATTEALASFTSAQDQNPLDTPFEIDGEELATGDLVLVKDQADKKDNGIYAVTEDEGDYVLARAEHFDGEPDSEVKGGDWVYVEEGEENSGFSYVVLGQGAKELGSDNIEFVKFSSKTEITATDALQFDDGVLSILVDDTSIEIYDDHLQVKSAGINSNHILLNNNTSLLSKNEAGDGNLALLKLNTQDQLELQQDTAIGDKVLVHGENGLRIGQDASEFFELEYLTFTLDASSTNKDSEILGFAHASFEGAQIDYKIKEATTNRVRAGTLYIATNGTDTSLSDTFTETGDVGVVWDLNISGANLQVRYTTTTNNKSMRCTVKRLKV